MIYIYPVAPQPAGFYKRALIEAVMSYRLVLKRTTCGEVTLSPPSVGMNSGVHGAVWIAGWKSAVADQVADGGCRWSCR